jgi:hypothetical protein
MSFDGMEQCHMDPSRVDDVREEILHLARLPKHRLFDVAIEHLLGLDRKRHAAAAAVLVRTGAGIVTHLLREAFRSGRPAPHRVQILDVVEQIGAPPDMDQWLTLQSCCSPRYPKSVQEKIAKVIARLGPPNRR